MKRILSIVLCFALLVSLFCQVVLLAFAAETPTITCESKECHPGDTITVAVNISNNPGIAYLELTPTYSSELGAPTVTNGSIISDFTKGKQYIWSADENATTNGTLVLFTFTVGGTVVPGNYYVGFTFRSAYNYDENNVTFTIVPATITVAKANGPAAPTGLTSVACTAKSNNDGKIQGVTTAMEYSSSNTFATKTSCTGTTITGLSNGTYYVRVAETATTKAGAYAAVEVAAYDPGTLGGTVSIFGTAKYNETLTAVTSAITGNTGTFAYQWKRGGTDITGAVSSTYTLTAADIGKSITVTVTSSEQNGAITSNATTEVAKADGPSAPSGLTGVTCTTKANNDGKIQGVTTAMEYKKSDGDWTSCTAISVTGLTPGIYLVRYKATTTHNESAEKTVVISEYIGFTSMRSGKTVTVTIENRPASYTLFVAEYSSVQMIGIWSQSYSDSSDGTHTFAVSETTTTVKCFLVSESNAPLTAAITPEYGNANE